MLDPLLKKIPKNGGPETLLEGQHPGNQLILLGADLFWASWAGDIFTCTTNGSSPNVLAGGQANPFAIVGDVDNLYWTNEGTSDAGYQDGVIMRLSRQGGTPIALATHQPTPIGIAVDSTWVYWTNQGTIENGFEDGSVMRAPLAGGPPQLLAGNQLYASRIQVDQDWVYWTRSGPNGVILKMPKDGGDPVSLATGQSSPAYGLALDGDRVYWTTNGSGAYNWTNGAVLSVAKLGGALRLLASSQLAPGGLAVDRTSIYWSADGLFKLTPK